jgi:hypothetical protein
VKLNRRQFFQNMNSHRIQSIPLEYMLLNKNNYLIFNFHLLYDTYTLGKIFRYIPQMSNAMA